MAFTGERHKTVDTYGEYPTFPSIQLNFFLGAMAKDSPGLWTSPYSSGLG
jgi:hypothetical protein